MTAWWDLAHCRGNPEQWFSTDERDQLYARGICHACPVSAECRDDEDKIEVTMSPRWWYGIRAGEDPLERKHRREAAGWTVAQAGVGVR